MQRNDGPSLLSSLFDWLQPEIRHKPKVYIVYEAYQYAGLVTNTPTLKVTIGRIG